MKRSQRAALMAATTVLTVGASAQIASADTLNVAGSTTVQPLAGKLAKAWKQATGNVAIVKGGGSGAGITCAAKTFTCDLGTSSRVKSGSDPANAVFTEIARDPIVVVVNKARFATVKGLSLAQVQGIFKGSITNWSQVGGAAASINVVQRASTSGTAAEFKTLFLKDPSATIPNAPFLPSNGVVRARVAGNRNAIGYVSFGFVETSTKIKALKIDGVAGTLRNSASNRYPYVRPLFFVTNGPPAGLAASFLAFARSTTGQRVVGKQYIASVG